jgi:hypothetical protein
MVIALIPLVVLFLYITPNIYNFILFKHFIVYLYFWPSNFKTVIIENHHQTNHCRPSATCTTLAAEPYYHAFLPLLICYTGSTGSESTENQNASLLNNILSSEIIFFIPHLKYHVQHRKHNKTVYSETNDRWCAIVHVHMLPTFLVNPHKVNLLRHTANTKFSLECVLFQWKCWKHTDQCKPDFYDILSNH